MRKIKCLVIDDEELARTLLKSYIDKLDFLELMGSFENPLDAMSLLKSEQIDLLLLDIQMPEIKGTDFARLISPKTKIIFTTAYSEYALEGFEINALDYLLKPITFQRFLSAIEKYPLKDENPANHLIIKSGYDLHKVLVENIIFIKSDSEYVQYHLENGQKLMANQSLSKLEKSLPDSFLRVHRSYIINRQKVSGLKDRMLLLSDIEVPVSDSYYEKVKKELFKI
ncbi:LytTR family DNA-binding domain-containing protein [Gramella sp. AN32]|uniref:LytR/AlgR family response regulator transcription factor n=1 Tax=Christiangramia antarctica TaxID=2058158 RepID=A0ABW5XAS7_9FLAO|nr:LytTR family DNA-binding domain-containing protein [Gramella sp. AN32]MCM4155507.1 DNA-binding response regulator [Gramella sp. AN32]